MSRPPVRLGVVVGLLALGVAVGQGLLPAQAARTAAPRPVAVVGASAVCPDLRAEPATGVTSRVAAGVTTQPTGSGGVVRRTVLGGLDPPGPAVLPLTGPGAVVADLGTTLDDAAYAATATQALAPGLTLVQTSTGSAGGDRGVSVLRCGPAVTDAWLVGGGATVGESSTLVLANPDAEDATVDVTVLSAEGPVDDRPGRGLPVPAGGRVELPLDTLAPDRSRLAVHVQATRGRVASALRHARFDGLVPRGVEHAAAAQPADELVVPGIPAGPGERAVWVANPGEVAVTVDVEVTTGDGQFVPQGGGGVEVPAGSTVSVDLSAALAGTAATATVTSLGGPVVAAGVAEETGAGDVRDLAYAEPAGALTGPALLPDVVLDGATDTVVLLSALTGDAVVDLALLPVQGQPPLSAADRRVEVPGGRTVALSVASLLPPEARGRVALEVRPDDVGSAVHAGVVVLARPPEGPLTTAYALRSALEPVARPAVVRDPGVVAGDR
jgi:hypothetical protein